MGASGPSPERQIPSREAQMADITREEWLTERLAYFKTPHAPAEHGV